MTRYYIFKSYKGYKQHVVDNLTRPKQFPLLCYCTMVAPCYCKFCMTLSAV